MVEELYSIYTCIHSQFLTSNATKIEIGYRKGKHRFIGDWKKKKKPLVKRILLVWINFKVLTDTGHRGQDTRGFHLCLNIGAKLLNPQLMKEGPHALSITGCFLDIKVGCSGDWQPACDSWQSQCLVMQSGLSGTSTANAHVTLRLGPFGPSAHGSWITGPATARWDYKEACWLQDVTLRGWADVFPGEAVTSPLPAVQRVTYWPLSARSPHLWK